VIFGALDKESLKHIADMTPREAATLLPLVVLTVFFGIYPAPLLDVFGASVENLMSGIEASLTAAQAATAASLP
jgi:NADH-quinone oxidoreductase subunit M